MLLKIVQTIIFNYSTEVNCKYSLTLIRLFYNYFLTENPNLHAVAGRASRARPQVTEPRKSRVVTTLITDASPQPGTPHACLRARNSHLIIYTSMRPSTRPAGDGAVRSVPRTPPIWWHAGRHDHQGTRLAQVEHFALGPGPSAKWGGVSGAAQLAPSGNMLPPLTVYYAFPPWQWAPSAPQARILVYPIFCSAHK